MSKKIILFALLIFVFISGCSKDDSEEKAKKEETRQKFSDFSRFQVPALPVTVAKIRTRTTASILRTSGRLESLNKVQVVSKISERVISVKKDVGDLVHQGEILVELDREQLELAKLQTNYDIEQAKVRLKRANLEFDKAKNDYEKAKNIFETSEGVYTEAEIKTFKHNADALAIDIEAQKISLKQAELSNQKASIDLENTLIKAPIAGIIVAKTVDMNEQVSNNQKLFEIENTDFLKVDVELTESEANKIFANQTAIIMNNDGSFVYLAQVTRIAPKVETTRGLLTITLEVLNWKAWRANGMISNIAKIHSLSAPFPGFTPVFDFPLLGGVMTLRPGMFVEVQISLSFHKNVVLLPKDAVNYDQDRTYVFAIDNKMTAVKKFVILDPEYSTPDSIEVIDGLRQGELVVIRHSDLKDGSRVQILEQR